MLHVLLQMVRPRPGPCRTCGPTQYPALNFNFCKTDCNWLARTGKGPVPGRGGRGGGPRRGCVERASRSGGDHWTSKDSPLGVRPGRQRAPTAPPQPLKPKPSLVSIEQPSTPLPSRAPMPRAEQPPRPLGASIGRPNQPGLTWEQRPKAQINHGPNHPAGRGLVRGGCRFCID